MDNHELKIRKGQAINIAASEAIAQGRSDDAAYIFERFLYWKDLANIMQDANPEEYADIKEALKK